MAKNLASVVSLARHNQASLSLWSLTCGSSRFYLDKALENNGIFFKDYATKTDCGFVMIGSHPEYSKHQTIIAKKLTALEERYNRFCHYMKETRHGWVGVRNIDYADNSIVQVQKSSLTGETREVVIVAPHGDLCY